MNVRSLSWLRRPVTVASLSGVALAALLSGGLVVAHAVDGSPAADTASTSGSGTDNTAVGVNTHDGRTVYAIKLKIVQTTADTVDATNAAVAVNDGCTDCSTVAIAFEGVLVVGSPSTFDPTNLALAYNSNCSGCTAFADAYQRVVQSSTRVRITKEGRRQIAAIRKDLESLRHESLTLDEIVARVKADEQAFAAVLLNEVVPVGHHPKKSAASDSASPGAVSASPDAGSASPDAGGATPDATTAPTADASPSSSDAPSDASPAPSDAASPSPSSSP